jgi:hypothetical protein
VVKGDKKVYFPRWYGIFIPLLLVPMWIWITYNAFYTTQGQQELGLGGWLMITFVFAVILVMIWLIVNRKIPAYIIAE